MSVRKEVWWGLGAAAVCFLIITFGSDAHAQMTGGDVICSKQSVGASLQWSTKSAKRASALHREIPPKPVRDDYWLGFHYHRAMLRWENARLLAERAATNSILSNQSAEQLILGCESRGLLGARYE